MAYSSERQIRRSLGISNVTGDIVGGSVRRWEDVVVFEGDSLFVQGAPQTNITYPDYVTVSNQANGGDTFTDLEEDAPTVDALKAAEPQSSRLFVLCGINSLLDSQSNEAATIHQQLKDYCVARKKRGWLVTVLTYPQADGLADATKLLAYNELIRANWTDYADDLIDVARDERMQDDTDTLYFNADNLHLNSLGYAVMNSMIAAPYQSVVATMAANTANFAGDVVAANIVSPINANTKINMDDTNDFIDIMLNGTRFLRFDDGVATWNPYSGNAVDVRAFSDDATSIFYCDSAANSGAGSWTFNSEAIFAEDPTFQPGSSLTPAANGDLKIEATNNTTLTFKFKGSDGTVRSGTVALS